LAEDIVFFIDTNMSGNDLVKGLRENGLHVEILMDHFDQDTPDHEWLPVVSKKNWIVITKDKSIRYNPLEKLAVTGAKARMFVLIGKDMSGKDMADMILASVPAIRRVLKNNSRPFIAKIYRDGRVTVWLDSEKLMKDSLI
jgi:predicted nuclease of predicted toxin-antitoxin system